MKYLLCCLPLALTLLVITSRPLDGQEAKEERDAPPEAIIDGEFTVRMLELEWRLTELAVNEAALEVEKHKLRLRAAMEAGDEREAKMADIELEQASMHRESQSVHREMAKLRFEHEREKLQRLSERLRKQSAEPDSVEVDVIEETGVIVVRGREADVNQITELTKPQGESPQPAEADFQFQVITLQYGDAEAIVVVLQDLFYRQSPEQVVVSFDERTNSVIARGTAADLAAIEALVERLDRE